MPMRRTIGMSLAFLMISAAAIAKTPGKNPSQHRALHGTSAAATMARHGTPWSIACQARHHRSHARLTTRHGWDREAGTDSTDLTSAGPPDAYLGPVRPIGRMETGTAAWYNWVGSRTSSGEILDSVTATAAHRSLPLASYARVTNLDTGRSVIVKINDRGPRTRRFIIDLSPRAASAIDVIRTGIAAVIVEPVMIEPPSGQAAARVAAFRNSVTAAQ
ncbi:MAG: septal ring lytic transglycosylase RlpA family protein [Stellaceae bacterium]